MTSAPVKPRGQGIVDTMYRQQSASEHPLPMADAPRPFSARRALLAAPALMLSGCSIFGTSRTELVLQSEPSFGWCLVFTNWLYTKNLELGHLPALCALALKAYNEEAFSEHPSPRSRCPRPPQLPCASSWTTRPRT